LRWIEAERRHRESPDERHRIAELERQQARYEATLAERRHAACDPDNRLIAAPWEKNWAAALRRVEAYQARLDADRTPDPTAKAPDVTGLAADLSVAWNAPGTTMRARQRLVRSSIEDIVAAVDEPAREVIRVIHWRGGQHSQLRITKPRTGEPQCRTPEAALAVMRSRAGRWDDDPIAASLNRLGMRTGPGKSGNAKPVGSLRRVHDIHAYRSADKTGAWLTMSEAAAEWGVTHHVIRRLIHDRIRVAEPVVPGAPYQIKASDLRDDRVAAARLPRSRPYQADRQTVLPMFPNS
jgi:hypothetical protein